MIDFPSVSSLTVCSQSNNDIKQSYYYPQIKKKKKFIRVFKKHIIDNYGEIQSNNLIGSGANASISLLSTKQRLYAVKIFKNHNNLKKLSGEFCISSILNHQNIIQTFDLALDNRSRYCIIMEYCPGGDLYSFIKDKRLNKNDINFYFKQLLNGLSYLHQLGISHRDIKPENLLISNQILKITDFGEADVFKQPYQSTTKLSVGLCGSTPYIAPEIFTHSKLGYIATKVDVWSAGIVLFCLHFNGVPFYSAQSSDSNFKLYKKYYHSKNYIAFQSLDQHTKSIIYNMLNPDSIKRITIQEAIQLFQ